MNGKILNAYILKHLLGKGGMSEVWYAENNLGKPATIKIMLQKFMDEDQVTKRFESEAKAMVQLNHPNIRQVIDFGEFEGRPFIIMEYLEGKDLNTALRSGRKITEAELKKWWKQCVSALEHTHSKGIIHRDIKPSNIFLQKSGAVKILDFGIAKVKDEISHTITGQALGTVMFMSPEQITDPKRVTAATDIYSLGITFAHLLRGKSPFNITEDDSSFAIQRKIVDGDLDLSGMPYDWNDIFRAAVEIEPTNRRFLKNFNPSDTTDETEVYPTENKSRPKDEPKTEISAKSEKPKKEKKRMNPVFYGIALLALLFGGGIYFFSKDRPIDPQTSSGHSDNTSTIQQESPYQSEVMPIVEQSYPNQTELAAEPGNQALSIVFISADKLNVVYRNLNNPIMANVKGVDGPVSLTASAGNLIPDGVGKWMFTPTAGTNAVKFTASVKTSDGKAVSVPIEFKVKPVPPARGVVLGKTYINVPANGIAGQTIRVDWPDFPLDISGEVTSFKVKVPGQPSVHVDGKMLSSAIGVLSRAKAGDVVGIYDIKYNSTAGSGTASPVVIELR